MSIGYMFECEPRTPEQVAMDEEYRKNAERIEILRENQRSLEERYDAIERTKVKTWEEAAPEIMPLLVSLVAWMRGETGEPIKGRKPDHIGWFIAGRPQDGWMEVGYYGPFDSGRNGRQIHPGMDELKKAGAALGELVTIEDSWIGGGDGIGFCCRTDAMTKVVTELPADLATITGGMILSSPCDTVTAT